MPEQTPTSKERGLTRRRLLTLGGTAAAPLIAETAGLTIANWHTVSGWFTTSGGPYLNSDWHPEPHVTSNSDWAHFGGDPSAKGKWQRDWHTVGLVATNATDFNRLQQEYPGGVQAVAFDPGGIGNIQVGVDHDGKSFYGIDSNNANVYLAGARLGSGDVELAQGLYLPRLGSFVVAKTVTAGNTDTASMARDTPGVWYV